MREWEVVDNNIVKFKFIEQWQNLKVKFLQEKF